MKLLSKYTHIANWAFNIAYLNILWILFTLVGLFIFGIFPATAAMFAVVRKWLFLGERDFNIFKTFWSFYRKDFFKLNGFAALFLTFGIVLYYNNAFLLLNLKDFKYFIPGAILISLVYVMTLLFFFPVFVHYKLKFFEYIKNSFLLAVLSSLELIGMVVVIAAMIGFIILIPGIIPLFSGSVLAISLMFLSKGAFKRLKQKTSQ